MNEVIEILRRVGAIIPNSHFVGTSGLHFDTYVNKDFLYPHTAETSKVCKLFAEKFKNLNIDVVVGPALGGIILSQWAANHLSALTGREVLGIYTEKSPEGNQIFTRGYADYVNGKNILIVEDIITTGGSLAKTIKAVKDAGGNIVSTAAIVNKNKDFAGVELGAPFLALSELFIETYDASKCPLCKSGIPINTKVGHGKKFLEAQNK
jgi:orotate phosphoribosyltransferase